MRVLKLSLKILGGLVALIAVAAGGFYLYLSSTWQRRFPEAPLPAIAASADSALIARGDYLVHAVAHCAMCHQEFDESLSIGDALKQRASGVGRPLSGGLTWDIPVLGRFVAANLTSDRETGLGAYSDGELARVIRSSVRRDGTVAPFMHLATGPMSDRDLTAVVSYLRTLAPVRRSLRPEAPGFVGKLVVKGLKPREAPPLTTPPEGGISVERGEYLAIGPAACYSCHSKADPMKGFTIVGPRFRGDDHAEADPTDPSHEFVTPNLTPDPETGHIYEWDEDGFVERFRGGVAYPGTKMPWDCYALMSEEDLRSIFRYLRSLPPVRHDVGPAWRPAGWKPDR